MRRLVEGRSSPGLLTRPLYGRGREPSCQLEKPVSVRLSDEMILAMPCGKWKPRWRRRRTELASNLICSEPLRARLWRAALQEREATARRVSAERPYFQNCKKGS